MSKCKLNELCQKAGWGTPNYSCVKQGQDHMPLFKASVVVNGSTFQSSAFFQSSKAAKEDVAGVAFSHYSTVSLKMKKLKLPTIGSGSNKNKGALKETAMKITPPDLAAPTTDEPDMNKSVESYLLCNKSVDEVETKKLKLTTMGSCSNKDKGALKETAMEITPPDLAAPTTDEPDKNKSVESYLLCNNSVNEVEMKKLKLTTMGSCSNKDKGVLKETAMEITPPDLAVPTTDEPDMNKSMESYLLCNKVRVYTSIPDVVLPKGSVVLPIAEGKWTIVSLE